MRDKCNLCNQREPHHVTRFFFSGGKWFELDLCPDCFNMVQTNRITHIERVDGI